MKLLRRQFLNMAGAAAALPAVSRMTYAQAWPSKTIRVIIPTGAGSATDVVPRIIFDPLSVQLGQAIILYKWSAAEVRSAVRQVFSRSCSIKLKFQLIKQSLLR